MRRAVVAGAFYEGERSRLQNQLQNCFSGITREEEKGILGAVVPHAGYIYSGRVAASVYAKLPRADIFVILGTNHQGIGSLVAVSKERWSTPLGDVEADEAFVDALPRRIIDRDDTAHSYEHSIEVQLPFLQYLFGREFRFVPISISLTDEDTTREIGEEVVNTITKIGKRVVVLASSDFTHYESERTAREKDRYVIEAINELDVPKFYKRVYERNVTACGIAPIATMMHAAKKLGATEGKLIKYATSADITGDHRAVVGYGGITII